MDKMRKVRITQGGVGFKIREDDKKNEEGVKTVGPVSAGVSKPKGSNGSRIGISDDGQKFG